MMNILFVLEIIPVKAQRSDVYLPNSDFVVFYTICITAFTIVSPYIKFIDIL